MDRNIRNIAVILLSFLPLMCHAMLGIVFITGKGDKKRDAEYYWKQEMVSILTEDYVHPYKLINYNGNLPFKQATPVVAKQIHEFISDPALPISMLVIITHSFGGDLTLDILCRTVDDKLYFDIASLKPTVFAIAPPFNGSAGADLAYSVKDKLVMSSLAKYVGQNTEATYDLTTANMKRLHDTWLCGSKNRPPLPEGIRFYTILGTKAWNFWDKEIDVSLKILAEISNLPKPNDGMVDVFSGEYIGTPFPAKPRTTANHDNNRQNKYDKFAHLIPAYYPDRM